MAIRRITISVPEELAEKVKDTAGETPVSAWVAALIERELEDERLGGLWRQHVADLGLEPKHYEWADRLIDAGNTADTRTGAA